MTLAITYKLDMERLLRKNDRNTLLKILPNEVRKYETQEKRYGSAK